MPRPFPTTPSEFGLLAWLEETRIQLPLRQVDSRFDVTGEFATVELTQVFQQTAAQSLDITYSFPLPANAAVYRCELTINDRVIKAVVMEKAEAAKLVKEKKAEGRRTGLVQVERDNLFTLDFGNAAPGDSIEVRFAYLQVLDRLESTLSLSIPFTPGVRYIPGKPLVRSNRGAGSVDDTDEVPDASRNSPPRIDANHPDMAELYIEGRLTAAEVDPSTMSSPSHLVILSRQGEHVLVRLATGTDIPNRDFVIRWEELTVNEATTHSWSCRHDGVVYALLQIRAPRQVAVGPDHPQDVYFLVDRSGSMSGVKWKKCAAALTAFVSELGANDRVWITLFESTFKDFAERPMSRCDILADTNFCGIEKMGTAGGTDLLPALKHVNSALATHSKGRKARIVLITDGQVGNEAAVQDVVKSQTRIPIYCFGIDSAVNDALLRNLASSTHGRCALMTPDDDITGAVAKLARTLRQPVLTGIKLCGAMKLAHEGAFFPDLCAGETSVVPLRCGTEDVHLEIAGTLANGAPWRTGFDLQPDDGCQSPRLAWARQRIDRLLANNDLAGAVKLACEHNVVCRGASFVAIDEAEKVPVAQRAVYQPTAMVCRSIAAGSAAFPPQQQNFFEGTVSDFIKRSYLVEAHDDDLDGGFASDMPSQRNESFQRPHPAIDKLSRDLHAWLRGHPHLLPDWIVESLVRILRNWMLEDAATRITIVESWIKSPPNGRPATPLVKLFKSELTGGHRDDAVKLLEQWLGVPVSRDGDS